MIGDGVDEIMGAGERIGDGLRLGEGTEHAVVGRAHRVDMCL